MSFHRSRLYWIFLVVLILSLGGIYASTLAPGLTWAHNGADGGDFISAVATGGVPHPTGYPTYLLLAQFFQMIPIGSLAFRTNLLSAVCAAIAAVFVYMTVIRLPFFNGVWKWLAGLIAALAYGLSPLAWSQAVITEVYGLQSLFIAVILYLWALRLESTSRTPVSYNIVIGLVCGLAMGNHLTTLFLLPLAFTAGDIIRRNTASQAQTDEKARKGIGWSVEWVSMGLRLTGFLIGLLVYLVLPLRASFHPPINWGNPVTIQGLIWLVSGQLYRGMLFGVAPDFIFSRVQYWANLLIDQFGWIGLAIGLYGLFSLQGNAIKKLYFGTGWLFFIFSIFSISYNSYDSDVYLLAAFMSYAIWVGLGAAGLVQWVFQRKAWAGILTGIFILASLVVPTMLHYPQIDVSHDRSAETYGKGILDATPAGAILFTEGDNATFTLWYFRFALHQRPDIDIVVTGLLPYDWYRQTLRSVNPSLNVPESTSGLWNATLISANPTRPSCFASSQATPRFSCR